MQEAVSLHLCDKVGQVLAFLDASQVAFAIDFCWSLYVFDRRTSAPCCGSKALPSALRLRPHGTADLDAALRGWRSHCPSCAHPSRRAWHWRCLPAAKGPASCRLPLEPSRRGLRTKISRGSMAGKGRGSAPTEGQAGRARHERVFSDPSTRFSGGGKGEPSVFLRFSAPMPTREFRCAQGGSAGRRCAGL